MPNNDSTIQQLLNLDRSPPFFIGRVTRGAAENGFATVEHPNGSNIRVKAFGGPVDRGDVYVYRLGPQYVAAGAPLNVVAIRRGEGFISGPVPQVEQVPVQPVGTGLGYVFMDSNAFQAGAYSSTPEAATEFVQAFVDFFQGLGVAQVSHYQIERNQQFPSYTLDPNQPLSLDLLVDIYNDAGITYTEYSDMDAMPTDTFWVIAPRLSFEEYTPEETEAIRLKFAAKDGLLIIGENRLWQREFNPLMAAIGSEYKLSDENVLPGFKFTQNLLIGDHPLAPTNMTLFFHRGPGAMERFDGEPIDNSKVLLWVGDGFDPLGRTIEPSNRIGPVWMQIEGDPLSPAEDDNGDDEPAPP